MPPRCVGLLWLIPAVGLLFFTAPWGLAWCGVLVWKLRIPRTRLSSFLASHRQGWMVVPITTLLPVLLPLVLWTRPLDQPSPWSLGLAGLWTALVLLDLWLAPGLAGSLPPQVPGKPGGSGPGLNGENPGSLLGSRPGQMLWSSGFHPATGDFDILAQDPVRRTLRERFYGRVPAATASLAEAPDQPILKKPMPGLALLSWAGILGLLLATILGLVSA